MHISVVHGAASGQAGRCCGHGGHCSGLRGPELAPEMKAIHIATVPKCLGRTGSRIVYGLDPCCTIHRNHATSCLPFAPVHLYMSKRAPSWIRITQQNLRFSTDREEVLKLLRGASGEAASSEEKKEDEMFSDLPGSLSDCDDKWRLNTTEYTGSSVSDHDNWVRDR